MHAGWDWLPRWGTLWRAPITFLRRGAMGIALGVVCGGGGGGLSSGFENGGF